MGNKQTILLLILVVLLAFVPLALQKDADFGGADDQVKDVIAAVNPNYQPWFHFIWEPPSGEVESFLFALQAGAGAGFIGYFFGYQRGRRATVKKEHDSSKAKGAVHNTLGLNG